MFNFGIRRFRSHEVECDVILAVRGRGQKLTTFQEDARVVVSGGGGWVRAFVYMGNFNLKLKGTFDLIPSRISSPLSAFGCAVANFALTRIRDYVALIPGTRCS